MSESGSERSRFVVGIDLGTTNSVLAYADTAEASEGLPAIRLLAVPQLTAPGTVEARTHLPSFLFLPRPEEMPAESIRLPWGGPEDEVVGTLAAKRASEAPDRVITSAKSWLCNERVDRTAEILPWLGDATAASSAERRRSPLAASTAYLAHLRDAWNDVVAHDDVEARLEKQEVFLTVPASFDAAARDLTVRAAADAGIERVHLLEEPQAAVYAWVEQSGDDWREHVQIGDVLLVCDVGGGTTDLSIVVVDESEGELSLRRVAVGDHLLLGGDNMDLALAYGLRERLAGEGKKLDGWQFRGLVLACREAKERLLGLDPPDKVPISILGRGSKLIGGTIRSELTREQVGDLLLDGFFPRVAATDRPGAGRQEGLTEIGLPYASDPGITRHLAEFLGTHAGALVEASSPPSSDGVRTPSVVLFNGGVMEAEALRKRVADVLSDWAAASGAAAPRLLSGTDFAHAVARGATYYGLARRGRGVRIRGGTARSYYVGIASAMPAIPGAARPVKALCVVPFGVEEGSELGVPVAEFGLLVGQPANFRFFASSTRGEDGVGLVLDEFEAEDLDELAPLSVQLDGTAGERVPVRLESHITAIGTLELWFVAREGGARWKLEFNVREPRTAS